MLQTYPSKCCVLLSNNHPNGKNETCGHFREMNSQGPCSDEPSLLNLDTPKTIQWERQNTNTERSTMLVNKVKLIEFN